MIVLASSMSAHYQSIYVGSSWRSAADIMELDVEQGQLVALRGLSWVVVGRVPLSFVSSDCF